MSRCTQILVALRHADPAALTAEAALQRSLGFEGRLRSVRRRILWELTGPEHEEPGRIIELLRLGGEVWNPNKEAARIRAPGEPSTHLMLPPENEGTWAMLLAWDPERDLRRTPAALRRHAERGWRLARGVLWALCWENTTAENCRLWSEQAALCRGPMQGLLIHPHLEDHRWIEGTEDPPWLPAPV
jgi:hypothetical protein